jgi:hypothetical protein
MKKKIILVTFCLILFLIFTASGYGLSFDPRFHGDPWDRLTSPPRDNNENSTVVSVVINPGFHIFILQTKDINNEKPGKATLNLQLIEKNETKFQK